MEKRTKQDQLIQWQEIMKIKAEVNKIKTTAKKKQYEVLTNLRHCF